MTFNNIKKILVIGTILFFIGASVLPSITGVVQNQNNGEIINDVLPQLLPRWREEGTPYNTNQLLHPYSIKLRDSPTSGYIESPSEYDPTRGVLFCYITGHWHEVVIDLVVELTQNSDFDDIAYVLVTSQSQMNSAITQFTANGADMSKVEFIIEPANAIWIRDYGPHFIFQDDTIGIVDSHYYPQRHLDNFIPTLIGDDNFIMPTYDIGLYYSGGNFLPGPDRSAFMSSLINLDNPSSQGFNEELIAELFQTYQGIDELHIMPQLPGSVDGTGHIDMWMYIIDQDTVIISEFKPGSDPTAIEITENAVPYMQNLGFNVYRTPAWNAPHPDEGYNTHWTYTNSFIANDRIFIPTYGENYPDYADEDAQALAAFQAAAPHLEIVEIDCFPIIWAAGAIHCIVMQVPRFTNPEPSVHVIWPDGGEFLASGTIQTIEWCATDTDNEEIPQIDLYYSIDGGNNYHFIDSTTDTGFYNWTVPYVETDQAKIKVVAISEDSDEGVGISTETFNISSSGQSIYDFVTGAGEDKYLYGYQTGSWTNINNVRDPVSTEIDPSDYPKIAYSDATGGEYDTNRYVSPNPSGGYESTHIYEFQIEEESDNIEDIEILWEGYSSACTQVELYIWDYIEGQWGDGSGLFGQNRYMDNWAGNRDGYLKNNIRSEFNRYISTSGQMTLLSYAERPSYKSLHDYISITISKINDAPDEPSIDGPTSGTIDIEYNYTINTIDPDGHDVFYYIDWGDGDVEEWIGPYTSESEVTITHTWEKRGNYEIKVKAKDTYDAESDWTELWISIPREKSNRISFLRLLQHLSEIFPILKQILVI
ncbi:MAG: agmatine deiminase family protein [Thermoplasmatales archaeon]|nr:MAG: agmatine deiminase family protein [Thermoplasmatales archaeon]